jgi:hypothetical protein
VGDAGGVEVAHALQDLPHERLGVVLAVRALLHDPIEKLRGCTTRRHTTTHDDTRPQRSTRSDDARAAPHAGTGIERRRRRRRRTCLASGDEFHDEKEAVPRVVHVLQRHNVCRQHGTTNDTTHTTHDAHDTTHTTHDAHDTW